MQPPIDEPKKEEESKADMGKTPVEVVKEIKKEKEKAEISLDTGVLSYAGVKYKIVVVPILLASFKNQKKINRIFSNDQKLGRFLMQTIEEYLKKSDEDKPKGVS